MEEGSTFGFEKGKDLENIENVKLNLLVRFQRRDKSVQLHYRFTYYLALALHALVVPELGNIFSVEKIIVLVIIIHNHIMY